MKGNCRTSGLAGILTRLFLTRAANAVASAEDAEQNSRAGPGRAATHTRAHAHTPARRATRKQHPQIKPY